MDNRFAGLAVGYDIPARPDMALAEVQTPCLILDLDALERNITRMGDFARAHGLRHRAHGKMHKSVDVARLQMTLGGACGICCQKVSEAEAFIRGGITDVLVSNQVRHPRMIDRLARLAASGAQISVCVDDIANLEGLASAAKAHGTVIACVVEMDVGAGRCGVAPGAAAVRLAQAIMRTEGLSYAGLQAYQGAMQHLPTFAAREAAARIVAGHVRDTLALLADANITSDVVTGGGTGSFRLDAASGVFTELQCGSYAFMDADYGRITDAGGQRLDQGDFENALFVLTSVMSRTKPDRVVVDAGHKSHAIDSGLPVVFGQPDLQFVEASDEHGIITDPQARLQVNDRLRLVPGHCDPTCNLHDWYVGVRGDRVETLWPVTARGKLY